MDYIKVLRALCDVNEHFNTFMRTAQKDDFYTFKIEDTDEYNDFTFVYEKQEVIITACNGATKAVLIIDGEPVVLKIGFSNYKMNHAAREAEVYWEAVQANVEQYFAPCEKIGEIFGTEIFTMEMMDADEARVTSDVYSRCSDSMSEEEIDEALDECEFIEDFFPFYYDEDLSDFFTFLFTNDINDLHTANMGYDDCGMIKLIDYSGYKPY